MSARPIDLKIAIPKTQHLERLQQQQNNIHKNDLHNHVVNTNNQVNNKLRKVINSEKTGYKRVDRDNPGKKNAKSNHHHRGGDREKNNETKDNKNSNKFLGNNVDIKI